MPAFVILGIGFPPQILVFDNPPVRVGRDPSNDIVLPSASASREHAQFLRDAESGRWSVACLSEVNPLVVDGKAVTAVAPVNHGAEVLVGADHLIVFCEDEKSAYDYSGRKDLLTKRECVRCNWTGMLSSVRTAAACPRCGGTSFRESGVVVPAGAGPSRPPDATTRPISTREMQQVFERIRQAKRSYLECVQGPQSGERAALSEEKSVSIGGADAAFSLPGIAFGSVRVSWAGDGFLVRNGVLFARVLLNGRSADGQVMGPGDVLEVGACRFVLGVRDE